MELTGSLGEVEEGGGWGSRWLDWVAGVVRQCGERVGPLSACDSVVLARLPVSTKNHQLSQMVSRRLVWQFQSGSSYQPLVEI